MKKAVLTGGNGFIGFELVKELVRYGYEVFAVIREESLRSFEQKIEVSDLQDEQKSRIREIPGDLRSADKIHSALREAVTNPDVFFHIAWNGSAGSARSDLRLQSENVITAQDMVKTASFLGCRKFVGAGSIMEDEVLKTSLENGRTTINQIYSASKLSAHLACRITAEDSGIDFCWGKITNAYGASDTTGRFIDNFTGRMLKGEPCSFSKADNLYDFVHVSDAARAFRLIGEKGRNTWHYVVGSGNAVPLRQYIGIMAEQTGTSSKITFSEDTSAIIYLPESSFDTSPLNQDTGYAAAVDFRDGISNIIEKKRMVL